MKLAKITQLNEKSTNIMGQLHALDNDIQKLYQLVQGRIRFGAVGDGDRGENIQGEWQVVSDTGSADTEFTVAHGLSATPQGYLVVRINKGGVVYDSGTTWTSSNLYLKCSSANAAVTLFLLK